MSFERILNQKPVIQALRSSIHKDRIPHAFLFAGPQGSGQRDVAAELSKALLCYAPKDDGGCDACQDCRMADSGIHPDLLRVSPTEENKRVIKVEPVRELIKRAGLRAFRSKRKVFIIEPAEAMNEVAQSALLKTLEEPPGDAVFVLITYAPEALLPTIRSRVQVFNFLPPESCLTDPETEKIKIRLLELILKEDFLPDVTPDLSKADRHALAKALDQVILNFRGAFLLKSGAGELAGIDASEDTLAERRLAERFSAESLAERIGLLGQAKENLLRSFNTRLTMAVLWDEFSYAK